jgi:hypothetical protein
MRARSPFSRDIKTHEPIHNVLSGAIRVGSFRYSYRCSFRLMKTAGSFPKKETCFLLKGASNETPVSQTARTSFQTLMSENMREKGR